MIIIYVISFVAIVKLFQYFYNRTNVKAKETITNSNSQEHKTYAKSSIEMLKELGKNKFLYPDDEFISHKKVKKYKPKNYDLK